MSFRSESTVRDYRSLLAGLLATVAFSAEAVTIHSSNFNAFQTDLAALAGPVSIVRDDLEDETPTTVATQSLTLAGSGIVVEVASGVSNSQNSLGIDLSSFPRINDDGTTHQIPVLGHELDLLLSSFSTTPSAIRFRLPNPVVGIGFEFDGASTAGFVSLIAGNSLATLTDFGFNGLGGTRGFVGVASDRVFDTFSLEFRTSTRAFDSIEIGGLVFATSSSATASEPVTAAMLLSGFLFGLIGRRPAGRRTG